MIEIKNINDIGIFLGEDFENSDIYKKSEKLIKENLKETKDDEVILKNYYYLLLLELKKRYFITGKSNILKEKFEKQILKIRNKYSEGLKGKSKKEKEKNKFQLISFHKIINNYCRSLEILYKDKGYEDLSLEIMIVRYRVERMVYHELKSLGYKYKARYIFLSILKYSSNYGTSFLTITKVTFVSIFIFAAFFWLTDHLLLTPDRYIVVGSDSIIGYLLYSMGVMSNLGTMQTPIYCIHQIIVFIEGMYGLGTLGLFLNLLYQSMK